MISALIYMNGCVPRYTCKQARANCAECLLPASGIREVPHTIMDRALPLSCAVLIKRDPYINKIYKSGNAGKDTREVAQTYRKLTEDNIGTAELIKTCAEDLELREAAILRSAQKYCKNLDLEYLPEKQSCVVKKDQ